MVGFFVKGGLTSCARRLYLSLLEIFCLPIVGASPLDNLFLNTGHGYLGWTTGAGASRLVVDAIMGRPSPIDPTPYRFGRF